MAYFALRPATPGASPRLDANHELGERTRLVHRADGGALVFSSACAAASYASARELAAVEAYPFRTPLGPALEEMATRDHCSHALLNGEKRIWFFSCVSGYHCLPGHFIRHDGDSYLTIYPDDEWRTADIFSEPLNCGCGAALSRYAPSFHTFSLDFRVKTELHQAIIAQHTTVDESGCRVFVRVDLRPPRENARLVLTLRTGDDETEEEYAISPLGIGDPGAAEADLERWEPQPLSGDDSIFYGPISFRDRMDSVRIEYFAGGLTLAEEITDVPLIQDESVLDETLDALRAVREAGQNAD